MVEVAGLTLPIPLCVKAYLQRFHPRRATVRVVLASSLATVLVACGAILANGENQRSIGGHRTALAARADGINTERALMRYWREREAMNAYLVYQDSRLLAEVASHAVSFDHALRQMSVNSQKERALVYGARAANAAFIAAFVRGRDAALRPSTAARALDEVDRRAALVVRPLGTLVTMNAKESRLAEHQASQASARARLFEAAAALVFLLAVMFFSTSAIRLFRRIAQQNRDLKLLDGLKDDFVATVSHELRTPLTSIRGYLELVLDESTGPLNNDQSRFLATIDRNSVRLLRLVGDLLFIAQIDAASVYLESAPVSLRALVEDAVIAAQPAAGDKNLLLTVDACDVQHVLVGDGPRLAQLLDNLLANAIKFTTDGSVSVSLRERAGSAVIEVTDTGMGISAEEQERLYERFYRTSKANTQAIQGSGIGLSIAKAIAEGHGGTIECESVEHQGTTFRVQLPLTNLSAEPRLVNAGLAAFSS